MPLVCSAPTATTSSWATFQGSSPPSALQSLPSQPALFATDSAHAPLLALAHPAATTETFAPTTSVELERTTPTQTLLRPRDSASTSQSRASALPTSLILALSDLATQRSDANTLLLQDQILQPSLQTLTAQLTLASLESDGRSRTTVLQGVALRTFAFPTFATLPQALAKSTMPPPSSTEPPSPTLTPLEQATPSTDALLQPELLLARPTLVAQQLELAS
jgi:hypothetical protein